MLYITQKHKIRIIITIALFHLIATRLCMSSQITHNDTCIRIMFVIAETYVQHPALHRDSWLHTLID